MVAYVDHWKEVSQLGRNGQKHGNQKQCDLRNTEIGGPVVTYNSRTLEKQCPAPVQDSCLKNQPVAQQKKINLRMNVKIIIYLHIYICIYNYIQFCFFYWKRCKNSKHLYFHGIRFFPHLHHRRWSRCRGSTTTGRWSCCRGRGGFRCFELQIRCLGTKLDVALPGCLPRVC